jgi:hypothetical protein
VPQKHPLVIFMALESVSNSVSLNGCEFVCLGFTFLFYFLPYLLNVSIRSAHTLLVALLVYFLLIKYLDFPFYGNRIDLFIESLE